MVKVVLIGNGSLAGHLRNVLEESSQIDFLQQCVRNDLEMPASTTFVALRNIIRADVYIICVSDNAIDEVAAQIPYEDSIIVHTSGAKPLSILSTKKVGVLYPVQTFTRGDEIDFHQIPIAIEANNKLVLKQLESLAKTLSNKVIEVKSPQRLQLHLAAVFANNFTNALFSIAEDICRQADIPFAMLYPLMQQTANKAMRQSPKTIQTGPAHRKDHQTINQHLQILENSPHKSVYEQVSHWISTHNK